MRDGIKVADLISLCVWKGLAGLGARWLICRCLFDFIKDVTRIRERSPSLGALVRSPNVPTAPSRPLNNALMSPVFLIIQTNAASYAEPLIYLLSSGCELWTAELKNREFLLP